MPERKKEHIYKTSASKRETEDNAGGKQVLVEGLVWDHLFVTFSHEYPCKSECINFY